MDLRVRRQFSLRKKVKLLEEGLQNLTIIVEKIFGESSREERYVGAAGGLAYGLKTFLGAKLKPGAELILEKLNFVSHLKGADLVITGEGCLDGQTCFDKAPIVVARKAHEMNIPVIAVCGTVGQGYLNAFNEGVTTIIPIGFDSAVLQPLEGLKVAVMTILKEQPK